MKTEDIIQTAVESLMDSFYGNLGNDESLEMLIPDCILNIFKDLIEQDKNFDLSFTLEGEEDEYFADYTYFRSEEYNGKIYVSIPYGEIEIEKQTYDSLNDDDKHHWIVAGNYAYTNLPAVTIVYDSDRLRTIANELIEELNS